MSPEEVAELSAKATAGPLMWYEINPEALRVVNLMFGGRVLEGHKFIDRAIHSLKEVMEVGHHTVFCGDVLEADADFIVAAYTHWPIHAAQLQEARERIEELEKALGHIAATSADDNSEEVARAALKSPESLQ